MPFSWGDPQKGCKAQALGLAEQGGLRDGLEQHQSPDGRRGSSSDTASSRIQSPICRAALLPPPTACPCPSPVSASPAPFCCSTACSVPSPGPTPASPQASQGSRRGRPPSKAALGRLCVNHTEVQGHLTPGLACCLPGLLWPVLRWLLVSSTATRHLPRPLALEAAPASAGPWAGWWVAEEGSEASPTNSPPGCH